MTHPSVASDTSPNLGEEFLGLKECKVPKVLKEIKVFKVIKKDSGGGKGEILGF